MRFLPSLCVAFSVCALAGCNINGGSSGGSSNSTPSDPSTIALTVATATVSGKAEWPGATTVSVTVDGVSVPVSNGVWTSDISFDGAAVKVLDVAVTADGVDVVNSEVSVTNSAASVTK